MEDKTLKKYYEIANKEFGVQVTYSQDKSIYCLISTIENLIDLDLNIIKLYGKDVDVRTYKIALNNKIILQEEFENIDVDSEPTEVIGFIISIIIALLSSNLMVKSSLSVLSITLVTTLSVAGFYLLKSFIKLKSNTDCINHISFYKLILEILHKK